jgi:hypothetical protein
MCSLPPLCLLSSACETTPPVPVLTSIAGRCMLLPSLPAGPCVLTGSVPIQRPLHGAAAAHGHSRPCVKPPASTRRPTVLPLPEHCDLHRQQTTYVHTALMIQHMMQSGMKVLCTECWQAACQQSDCPHDCLVDTLLPAQLQQGPQPCTLLLTSLSRVLSVRLPCCLLVMMGTGWSRR